MFYTYILINRKLNKTYTGSTDNLLRRLEEHNNGRSVYTRNFRPWELFYQEEYKTLNEARRREKYLKSCAGRKFIKKLFEKDR